MADTRMAEFVFGVITFVWQSLAEEQKRSKALQRLEQRLACPWNLKINPNTDDQGMCFG
jgi:hypothetical protein